MQNSERLTKANILELTDGGIDYFISIFPAFEKARINDTRFKNICNHYRGEKHPSLSCYYRNARWYLHDHGDPNFSGDMFSIYALVNGIDNVSEQFNEIIQGIYTDVTGEEPPEMVSSIEESELPEDVPFRINEVPFDNMGVDEEQFLKEYGILVKTMEQNNSVFLSSYTFRSKNDGKVYTINKKPEEVIIGHRFGESVKIYRPYVTDYKFMWLGEKPEDYVYGITRLRKLNETLSIKSKKMESLGQNLVPTPTTIPNYSRRHILLTLHMIIIHLV